MKTFREFHNGHQNKLPDALNRARGLSEELCEALKDIDEIELPDRISHFISRIAQQSVALRHNINRLAHRVEDEGDHPIEQLEKH